jgi:hypothetical protein
MNINANGEVYSMQHYVIKFFSATGRWFSPVTQIEILLKVAALKTP